MIIYRSERFVSDKQQYTSFFIPRSDMSENEDTEKRYKKKAKTDRKINSSKEKKRKRKTTESEEPKIDSEEILDDAVEGVTKEPKEPSKRQAKKNKFEQRYADQREASQLRAAQKALTYVSKWKHAKSDWKFEKLRQIWLMDNLLDDSLVPDSIFPIALEYFEGCKGMARQQLVKKMMDVIKKVEEIDENDKTDENQDSKATETAEYQRARQILQAFPTES